MKINKVARALGRRQHALIVARADTGRRFETNCTSPDIDSFRRGYDVAAYLRLEVKTLRQKELIATMHKGLEQPAGSQSSTTVNRVNLPKTTIPKFDGYYLKGKHFQTSLRK